MEGQTVIRTRALDGIGMSRHSEGDPQDRIRELEEELAGIRRRLLSVPDMDRHYAYRMRVSVNKVVDSIAKRLHQ